MSNHNAELAESTLINLFGQHDELAHLRVKKRGKTVTVYSTDEHGDMQHVRFKLVDGLTWTTEFPTHRERWEKTPFTGSIKELAEQVITDFSWALANPHAAS